MLSAFAGSVGRCWSDFHISTYFHTLRLTEHPLPTQRHSQTYSGILEQLKSIGPIVMGISGETRSSLVYRYRLAIPLAQGRVSKFCVQKCHQRTFNSNTTPSTQSVL